MRDTRGITLIALIITIIVLVILAGIAINLTIGNNGLFTRAENAANAWIRAEANEKGEMSNFESLYDNTLKDLGLDGGNEESKNPLEQITGNEKTNTDTKDKEGNRIVIPAGFKVVNPEATVEEGIIIEDVSANNNDTIGNQFVWIPCTVDGANGSLKYDRYAFTRDGWKYGQTNLGVQDEDGSYKIQRVDSTSYYYHQAMIEEERASIEKYGGYYIGRYEVGCDTERTLSSKGNIESVAKIKENLNVYNYITRDEAKIISERMYTGKSRLCSSYAWDTALQFIGGEYAVNSEGGNYIENGVLETTGYHAVKNIFDIGGNVWEWTTETYSDDDYSCVGRGGGYYDDTLDYPAGHRGCNNTVYSNNSIRC